MLRKFSQSVVGGIQHVCYWGISASPLLWESSHSVAGDAAGSKTLLSICSEGLLWIINLFNQKIVGEWSKTEDNFVLYGFYL